jgi:late competence protein required for DNA uptake (superfamily II DNA/RNA helicase)
MSKILNNHSAFNKWQVSSGFKQNNVPKIDKYIYIKKYTKSLKANLSYSIKELIVKDINSQKGIVLIGYDNIDEMINGIPALKDSKAIKFQELRKRDLLEAFRYLHKLTYG